MSPFICVRLAGGLGNQLFQLSAAIKIAATNNLPYNAIYIDTRYLSTYEAKHSLQIEFVTDLLSGVRAGKDTTVLSDVVFNFRLARLYEGRFGLCEFINSVDYLTCFVLSSKTKYVFLDGYFQHPDVLFSEDQRTFISTQLLESHQVKINLIKAGRPSIGIHIRRGDYVTSSSANRVFRTIPIEYYREALRQFNENSQVLVFSDDPCISAQFAYEFGGIDTRKINLSLQEEFCLLMSCDNYVIANSTFSWWAAYLGYNKVKKIIAPLKWYHDEKRNYENSLLLKNFTILDY